MASGPAGRTEHAVDTTSLPYRGYLAGLAIFSIAGLFSSFVQIQKIYAVVGALFIPALAAALLILNGRRDWIGSAHRNRPMTAVMLIAALGLFLLFGIMRLS